MNYTAFKSTIYFYNMAVITSSHIINKVLRGLLILLVRKNDT